MVSIKDARIYISTHAWSIREAKKDGASEKGGLLPPTVTTRISSSAEYLIRPPRKKPECSQTRGKAVHAVVIRHIS